MVGLDFCDLFRYCPATTSGSMNVTRSTTPCALKNGRQGPLRGTLLYSLQLNFHRYAEPSARQAVSRLYLQRHSFAWPIQKLSFHYESGNVNFFAKLLAGE